MRRTLLLASQLLFVGTLHVSAKADDFSLSLLPTAKSVVAKVMQIGTPVEAHRTAEKIAAALAGQPDWARTFIAANDKSGTPLPYHPNLQVTKDEYHAFLAAAAKPTLIQVGTVSLWAERQRDGSIRLHTVPTSSKVNGVTIGVDGKSVTTALATLAERNPVDNRNAEGATGRWAGTQWRNTATSSNQFLAVKFAIGKRTDHGDGMIYYDIKNVQGAQSDVHYEILLFSVPN